MARQAFKEPDDDAADDVFAQLTGAPVRPTTASATTSATEETRAAPEVRTDATIGNPAPQPRSVTTGERTTQPGAGATQRPAPNADLTPTNRMPPTIQQGITADKGKRIGLYVDTRRWLWLKRLSVQRAERGLPADFTSIVLEALDDKYPQ